MSAKNKSKPNAFSSFVKMGMREKDPEPDFNDCLMKVFRQKLQRKRQEHGCKVRKGIHFSSHDMSCMSMQ